MKSSKGHCAHTDHVGRPHPPRAGDGVRPGRDLWGDERKAPRWTEGGLLRSGGGGRGRGGGVVRHLGDTGALGELVGHEPRRALEREERPAGEGGEGRWLTDTRVFGVGRGEVCTGAGWMRLCVPQDPAYEPLAGWVGWCFLRWCPEGTLPRGPIAVARGTRSLVWRGTAPRRDTETPTHPKSSSTLASGPKTWQPSTKH